MNVACIVVTYNRKNLLINCLDAINRQSIKPNIIYIIDNASTDGTPQFVEKYKSEIAINYIKLKENIGGAGGFYSGMKAAYDENKYDFFWVMDDDGEPDESCLKNLLKYSDHDYLAPLVLDIHNKENVAFPYLPEKTLTDIKNKYGNSNRINNYANPFNGILYSNRLIKSIGFPKKEMFIWGDEVEYHKRAAYYGFTPLTIVNAIHYHPLDRLILKKNFLGGKTIVDVDSKLRMYCRLRNEAFTLSRYSKLKIKSLFYITYIYYYIITKRFDIKSLLFFLKATKDGRNNIFTNHVKYL